MEEGRAMKAKVCFKCKQYQPIHPENHIGYELVKHFEFLHFKHPTQTLDLKEIPKDFKLVVLVKVGGGFNGI